MSWLEVWVKDNPLRLFTEQCSDCVPHRKLNKGKVLSNFSFLLSYQGVFLKPKTCWHLVVFIRTVRHIISYLLICGMEDGEGVDPSLTKRHANGVYTPIWTSPNSLLVSRWATLNVWELVGTATLELNCKTEKSHTFRTHTMAAERERWGGVMHKTRVSN